MSIKKVVIIGPESTGKSTLSQMLSSHYQEPWVREYARTYLEQIERDYEYEDLLEIAKGQLREEKRLQKEAEKLLFCDTNLMVLDVWSQHKYGKTHEWTLKALKDQPYDLYLLTDIDMPWEPDPQREHPDPKMRKYFFELYSQKVEETGVPFSVISGNREERLANSIEAIAQNLRIKPTF